VWMDGSWLFVCWWLADGLELRTAVGLEETVGGYILCTLKVAMSGCIVITRRGTGGPCGPDSGRACGLTSTAEGGHLQRFLCTESKRSLLEALRIASRILRV
jgi:hypothetical protein